MEDLSLRSGITRTFCHTSMSNWRTEISIPTITSFPVINKVYHLTADYLCLWFLQYFHLLLPSVSSTLDIVLQVYLHRTDNHEVYCFLNIDLLYVSKYSRKPWALNVPKSSSKWFWSDLQTDCYFRTLTDPLEEGIESCIDTTLALWSDNWCVSPQHTGQFPTRSQTQCPPVNSQERICCHRLYILYCRLKSNLFRAYISNRWVILTLLTERSFHLMWCNSWCFEKKKCLFLTSKIASEIYFFPCMKQRESKVICFLQEDADFPESSERPHYRKLTILNGLPLHHYKSMNHHCGPVSVGRI